MGLLQNIEGIFGFGKKKNQTSQNASAIANAIAATKAKLAADQVFVEALKPFAAENAVFAAAISTEEVIESEAQVVLSWLQTLFPASPVAPPIAPAPVANTGTPIGESTHSSS